MMQDLKHLVIIDSRPSQPRFIRSSLPLTPSLIPQIDSYESKLSPQEMKVKRVVFVDQVQETIKNRFSK
jgi:hypothetical protein